MSGILAASGCAASTPLSVVMNPDSVDAVGSTSAGTTPAATADVTGGIPPYSYAWTRTGGDTCTINSPTASSTTFSFGGLTSGQTKASNVRITVTDALANTAFDDGGASYERT